MKQWRLFIIFVSISMLVACNNGHVESKDNHLENAKNVANSLVETEETLKEVDEAPVSKNALTTVEEVFNETKEAMGSVTSLQITGTNVTETTMNNTIDKETTETVTTASLNPYVQHVVMTTNNQIDGLSEAEMYFTDNIMYVTDETGRWLQMDSETLGNTVAILLDSHFDHFITHKESFELTEDDNHYIITYNDSPEKFKEIIYEGVQINLLGDMFADSVNDMEVTGELVLKIAKDTHYVVEQIMNTDMTMQMLGMEVHTVDEASYLSSDFNEVKKVVVPNEVIEGAISAF